MSFCINRSFRLICISKSLGSDMRLVHKNALQAQRWTSTNEISTNEPSVKIFNVNNAVDKEHELKALKEIIKLPVSALQGLDEKTDEVLKKLKITSIKKLGEWKAFKFSKAVVHFSAFEESGCENLSHYNLEKGLDKDFQGKTLNDLLDSPLHSIKGIAPWVDEELAKHKSTKKIKTIKDLAKWKYANMAEQLIVLSQFEE